MALAFPASRAYKFLVDVHNQEVTTGCRFENAYRTAAEPAKSDHYKC